MLEKFSKASNEQTRAMRRLLFPSDLQMHGCQDLSITYEAGIGAVIKTLLCLLIIITQFTEGPTVLPLSLICSRLIIGVLLFYKGDD